MSGVRIEDDAFGDTRYDVLARACGLADADHARGKMARLWRQCTAESRYVLPVEDVESVLGENAVAGLERARLGEKVRGGVRIRGTQGRIEWLGKLRDNGKFGKLGGRPKGNPRGLARGIPDGPPLGSGELTPLVLVPAPVLVPSLSLRDGENTGPAKPEPILSATPPVKAKRPRPAKAETALPADWAPNDTHARIAREERVDLARQADLFRDHAATTARLTADWDAAFRTWLRRANDFARSNTRGGYAPPETQRSLPKLG